MTDAGCIFCRMVAGEVPVTGIWENESVLAFLDIAPISTGHTLVIPKRHFARLHECPADVLAEMASRAAAIGAAVKVSLGFDGYNVFCNNGRAAGQIVDHVHFHVVGRREGDKVFTRWRSGNYAEDEAGRVAEKIKKTLLTG